VAKNKREAEGIDEAALLQSIYEQDGRPSGANLPDVQEKPAEPVREEPEISESIEKPKEAKEHVRRKKGVSVDYSSQFLQRNGLKERSCVYISRRIHATISEIVRVIADRDVTVGGYIDNVLLQHLELHRDEINNLYKRERKDLIEF
jgi:hypothetical protein